MQKKPLKLNTGSLHKNKNKETEKHADCKGSANVAGVLYWVSGWTNTIQDTGEKWVKLSFTKKELQPLEAARAEDAEAD